MRVCCELNATLFLDGFISNNLIDSKPKIDWTTRVFCLATVFSKSALHSSSSWICIWKLAFILYILETFALFASISVLRSKFSSLCPSILSLNAAIAVLSYAISLSLAFASVLCLDSSSSWLSILTFMLKIVALSSVISTPLDSRSAWRYFSPSFSQTSLALLSASLNF